MRLLGLILRMNIKGIFLGTVLVGTLLLQAQGQTLDLFQIGARAVANPATNVNVWPSSGNEDPLKAIDGLANTKYLNFGELNTGYILTVTGTEIVNGLSLTTANDGMERDPASFSLWGSNTVTANATPGTVFSLSSFTPIVLDSPLSLPTTRLTAAPLVSFENTTPFSTYLLVFPTVRTTGSANSMQIAEAQLMTAGGAVPNTGTIAGGQLIPEPGSMVLLGAAAGILAMRRRR